MATKNYKIHVEIPFPSNREADIAFQVLRVDKEPPRSQVTKNLILEDSLLKAKFSAPQARSLRVGVNSFLDHVMLVCETMNEFGPPVSTSYTC